ncbi:hypothetical protein IWW34DRAFT_831168 [Fusarium oxysporum f. sp. albedinis]|jgi:hypothetical protein|nr:hypothetical protein IWW34DRAFT_831168 [Fusarium oxysporum f. sp. albedinis]KAJ0145875.1 hypothetical protein HZ326_11405 [Fusarium oxysporum f. sp. albedinis]
MPHSAGVFCSGDWCALLASLLGRPDFWERQGENQWVTILAELRQYLLCTGWASYLQYRTVSNLLTYADTVATKLARASPGWAPPGQVSSSLSMMTRIRSGVFGQWNYGPALEVPTADG